MAGETQALLTAGQKLDIYHVNSKKSLSFKAFLTEFEDDYDPSWNTEAVFGRNDPHQTFENIKRIINVSWELPSENIDEAQENMKKLSALINMNYPDYNANAGKRFTDNNISATAISASPFFKIKFMNLIQDANASADFVGNFGNIAEVAGLPGIMLKTPGLKPVNDMGYFVDNIGEKIYPKVLSLSFQYAVLHSHPLGWRNGKLRKGNFPYGENLDDGGHLEHGTRDTIEAFEGEETDGAQSSTEQQNSAKAQKITGGGGGSGGYALSVPFE